MSREKYAERGASNEMKMTVASNLKYYLNMRGKNQVDLAIYFNRPQSSISSWFIGQSLPGLSQLKDIADYLGVTIDDLITSPEEKLNYRKNMGLTDIGIDMAQKIEKLDKGDKQLVYALINRLGN